LTEDIRHLPQISYVAPSRRHDGFIMSGHVGAIDIGRDKMSFPLLNRKTLICIKVRNPVGPMT